jgi:hypothetical protein
VPGRCAISVSIGVLVFAESGLALLMVCIVSDGGGDDSDGSGGFLKL